MRSRILPALLLLVVLPLHAALTRLRSDQPLAPLTYGGVLRSVGAVAIASDGTDFLVIFKTLGFLAATRIAPSGSAYGPSIRVADVSDDVGTSSCAAAWTGAQYVVACNSRNGIVAWRLSREGQLLDVKPRTVASSGAVAMAWNGRNLLVVSGGLRYRLLDRDGVPATAEQPLNAISNSSAVAASNGDGFLVAGIPGLGSNDVVARPIDAAGALGPVFTIPFAAGGSSYEIELASDGHDYLAAIGITTGTSATLVRADMSTGSPKAIDASTAQTMHVVWNGSEYLVVWERLLFAAGIHDAAGVRIAANGNPIDAQGVTIQANGESVPAVGTNGTDTMVIATDQDSHRASATIFRSLGTIGTEPAARRRAAILNVPRDQSEPAIATNGVYSLAVWRESTDLVTGGAVLGALVGPSGEIGRVLDIGADSLEASHPAVASNGRDFLVFWQSQAGDVLARRVGVDGNLLDAAPIFLGRVARATRIAATWSGAAYLGTWTSDSSVLVAAVSAAGAVTNAAAAINNAPAGSADHPAIACDATGCTEAWHAGSSTTIRGGIFSIALTSAGTASGGQITIVDEPSTHDPAVVRDPDSGGGWNLFSHLRNLYDARGPVALLLDTDRIFYESTAGGARVIATQRDGVYWTDSFGGPPPRLLFGRVAADGTRTGTVEVDAVSPDAVISSAQRLFVIYTETQPELGGNRLILRTLATPDPTPVMPRRRSAR